MKLSLDTERLENSKLTLTEKECEGELADVIQDFCFGIASFFTDFAMKIDCTTEQAKSLKSVCLSCIEGYIETILEQGVLEDNDESGTS